MLSMEQWTPDQLDQHDAERKRIEDAAFFYGRIREFVADTVKTRTIQYGLPSARTQDLESWAFRQIIKRYFPDLD
jgi:hypothetical protein